MLTRIRDAWKVLLGTAKAVPPDASWWVIDVASSPSYYSLPLTSGSRILLSGNTVGLG